MRRRPFNTTSAVPLLLCITIAGVWGWSYHAEMQVGVRTQAGRFTVRLTRGTVALWGPPPPASSVTALEKWVEACTASLRNDQIHFGYVVLIDNEANLQAPPSVLRGTPSGQVLAVGNPQACVRPLLKALEDPNQIGAAHCLLTIMTAPPLTIRGRRVTSPYGPIATGAYLESDPAVRFDAAGRVLPHSIRVEFNGLHVELWPNGATPDRSSFPVKLGGSPPFALDPTSFASVRAYWHRRLDARLVFVPAWVLPVVIASYPLILLAGMMRRHAAIRRGCCGSCGYNLSGNTSGVCPECGTAVPNESASKSRRPA